MNSGAAESKKTCEKYLCTKDQCTPLRNRGLRMRTSLGYQAAYVTSIYLTLAYSV
jgi:hypothetical protein